MAGGRSGDAAAEADGRCHHEAFGMKCRNDYEINSLPRHFWLTARTCGKGLFGELANLETT